MTEQPIIRRVISGIARPDGITSCHPNDGRGGKEIPVELTSDFIAKNGAVPCIAVELSPSASAADFLQAAQTVHDFLPKVGVHRTTARILVKHSSSMLVFPVHPNNQAGLNIVAAMLTSRLRQMPVATAG